MAIPRAIVSTVHPVMSVVNGRRKRDPKRLPVFAERI